MPFIIPFIAPNTVSEGCNYSPLALNNSDLGTNWNVDIAFLLEEYLDQLEKVTISLDNGKTQLNFAQAALLIQGSSQVYSKKVEYLFRLTNQALDIIRSRKDAAAKDAKNVEDKANGNGNNDGDDIIDDDEPQLLPLDDKTLAEAHNIDLNEEPVDYITDRAKTMIPRAPISVLTISDTSDSGEARHYKISNCIVHSSGALLLEERDTLLLDSVTLRRKSMIESTPFGSPLDIPGDHEQRRKSRRASMIDIDGKLETVGEEEKRPSLTDQFEEVKDQRPEDIFDRDMNKSMVNNNNNNNDPLNDPSDDEDNASQQGERESKQKRAPADQHTMNGNGNGNGDMTMDDPSQNGYDDDEVDPWAMVDEYDPGSVKPVAYQRGITYRKPKPIKSADLPSSSIMKQFVDVLQSRPLQAKYERMSISNQLKLPYWSEFSSMYVDAMKKQHELRRVIAQLERQASEIQESRAARAARRNTIKSDLEAIVMVEQKHEPQDDELDDPLQHDSSDDDNDNGGKNEWDDEHKQDADGKSAAADNLPEYTPPDQMNTSVDDGVWSMHKHMEEIISRYQMEASEYMVHTDLGARVAEWQDRLMPALEEEERRQAFDIHSYGRHIIDRIDHGDDKDLVAPKVMNFETAIAGQERYQVCRFFLATLQLANGGNVEIIPSVLTTAEDKSTSDTHTGETNSKDKRRGGAAAAAAREADERRWQVADATNSSMQLRLLRKEIREVDIDNEGYRLTADDIKESKDNAAAAAAAQSSSIDASSSSSSNGKPKRGRKPKGEAKTKAKSKTKAAATATSGKKRSRATTNDEPQYDEHGEAIPSSTNGDDDGSDA